ncbi:MAG: THUMP domain-containing protein, partial [Halobacteria archaeon]|nr:THUMP domain-containing protein [Halobacteria archaeon]
SAVYQNLEDDGYQPEVDLDDPDLLLRVECRKEEAFVFLEKREGPGGLPLGSQDGVVALVSGGIDSPVAAWSVMKRGCPVVPVYLDLGDYGGVDHRERAVETARRLNEYAPNHARGLRRVPAGDVVEELVDEVGDTRMLSYRRFMLRVAEEIAEEIGAVGIVTGGSVGQKSSQTSRNLRVIDAAVDMPVHRPLLSFDKQEIIDRAREIGTYDDSTVDVGCNRIAPDNPKTGARLSEVVEEEPEELLGRAKEVAEETVVENASSGNETRVVEGDGG